MSWRTEYRVFRCERQTGDDVFDQAASFADEIASEFLIGISHALEREHVVAAVWWWAHGAFWTCPKCGERIDDQFDSCWSCSTPKPTSTTSSETLPNEESVRENGDENWSVHYRVIRGGWLEWNDFFAEVAKAASEIGPERLIGITHSGNKEDALAGLFYWSEKDDFESTDERT